MWLFKNPPSEVEGADDTESDEYLAFPEDQLDEILELDDLARLIGELSQVDQLSAPDSFRPDTNARNLPAVPPDAAALITNALETKTDFSLYIGVRYTDKAFFLSRKDGHLNIDFCTHPLRFPEEDALVERICLDRGLHPTKDYLADAGRTRLLSYSLQDHGPETVGLVYELLRDAYRAEADDEIVVK